MERITVESHPTLFGMLQMIDQDTGRINRLEPAKVVYVTGALKESLDSAEKTAASLTEDQRETLAIGEDGEEVDAMLDEDGLLELLDVLDVTVELND